MRQGAAQSAPTSFPSTTTRIIMLIIVNRSRLLYYSSCNKFFCYHGQEHVTCPNCGTSGNVVSIEQVDLKGGDY